MVGTRPIGEKKGTKRNLLVDGRGVPLSLVVCGANRHDVTQLEAVLNAVVFNHPQDGTAQHLCADAAYDSVNAHAIIIARGYIPHVRPRNVEAEEKKTIPGYKARRWVVEACHAWINRFRKLLVRFEKTDASYLALIHLACAIICWRKIGVVYG